jgi:hypothetical protein
MDYEGAECFVFDTDAAKVITLIESLGAVRAASSRFWYYPSEEQPKAMLWLMCRTKDEADQFGLGDTIDTYIAVDLSYEAIQDWQRSLGGALNKGPEVGRYLLEHVEVILRVRSMGDGGLRAVRDFLSSATSTLEVIWFLRERAWTSTQIRHDAGHKFLSVEAPKRDGLDRGSD